MHPWVSMLAYCTRIYNPQTGLSRRLWLPEQAEVGRQRAAALWTFVGTATRADGHCTFPNVFRGCQCHLPSRHHRRWVIETGFVNRTLA